MASKKKLKPMGVGLVVFVTTVAISIGGNMNPFQDSFQRIVFSGLVGGGAAATGVVLAHLLGLVTPIENEDN